MQVISKFSKGFRFLFCVANVYSKYACVIPVIDKVITITKAFQKNVYKSKRKPNKINEIIARKNGIEVLQRIMKENVLLLKDSLGH